MGIESVVYKKLEKLVRVRSKRNFKKKPPTSIVKTSIQFKQILAELNEDEVAIRTIVRRLRRRSFGGIMILLAIIGLVPGISILSGFLLIILGFQMTIGFLSPGLPRYIGERKISVDAIKSVGDQMIPWIERLEDYVRPRWLILTVPPIPLVVGFLTMCLALVMMLPIPFSNFPPAVAIVCLSLGLLERDGILIGIGIIVTSFALALGCFVAMLAVNSLLQFLN